MTCDCVILCECEARAGQHPHTPDSGCDSDPVRPVFAQLSTESWFISDPDPGIF